MIWVLLQSESPWQCNDAIMIYIYLCVSLYQEFLKKSLKGVYTCHMCTTSQKKFASKRTLGYFPKKSPEYANNQGKKLVIYYNITATLTPK